MAQKYRIYINEKVILLTETVPKKAKKYQQLDARSFDLKTFYNQINEQEGCKLFYLLCDNPKDFLKKINTNITVINAAGGMVVNSKGEYLFIYRNGKWDLPKGKIEKGERRREGALREVEEECGIAVSSIGKRICKTYHTYTYKGDVVLKVTFWYQMKYNGAEKLKPQKEEGITDVRWFKKGKIDNIANNTFSSILDVLAKLELLKDKPVPLSE